MSRKGAAPASRCVPALPEEIHAEILARVQPPDAVFLFRCALVCKRWRRLLADPAFLRRIFQDAGRSSSLVGFLVQRHWPHAYALKKFVGIIKSRMLAFVPAPGSALGPHRRPLTSFVRHGAGLLDCAEPLAARDGLLLLRLPPFFTLCVCSLITGKLDLLPLLDAASFDDEGVRGYAILRSADHGDAPHRPAARPMGTPTCVRCSSLVFIAATNNCTFTASPRTPLHLRIGAPHLPIVFPVTQNCSQGPTVVLPPYLTTLLNGSLRSMVRLDQPCIPLM
ncbi:unnamed protein product [Urochloa humidicola]